jgi:hypothetical protein
MPEACTFPTTEQKLLPTNDLVLRICSEPNAGRLVRLKGAKCAIGSGEQCALRIRGAGISPMHCLIIRGPERTVIRRWAENARLNGETFSAAELKVGDRLTVGPVELEVLEGVVSATRCDQSDNVNADSRLETEQTPDRPQPPFRTPNHHRSRARRLLGLLRETRRENELNALRLVRLEQSCEKLEQALAAAQAAAVDKAEQAEALSRVEASLNQTREELVRQREQLDQERQVLEQDRVSLASNWEDLRKESAANESKQFLLQQELRAFEEHKRVLTQERIDWQAQVSRAEADIAKCRDEIERQTTALDKQMAEVQAASRRLTETEAELLRRRDQLAENERNHAEREAQLEQRRSSQAQTEHDDLTRRLSDQARQLTEATERLNRATHELQQYQELLQSTRQELDDQRTNWEAERDQLVRDHAERLAELRVQNEELYATVAAAATTEVPTADQNEVTQSSASTSASSDSEVFSRLQSLSLLKSTESPAQPATTSQFAEPDQATGEFSTAGAASLHGNIVPSPTDFASHFTPPRHEPVRGSEDDDESIDSYMAQLLKRVSGISIGQTSTAPASHAPLSPAPVVSQPLEKPLDQPAAPAHDTPTRVRRIAAPELSSDLAAMRELANLSARAAIDTHTYRNWGRAAFGKFTIATLAAIAGAGAIYFASTPSSILMYAGLATFVVALFWLLQAGILINNVLRVARRNDRFLPKATEEDSQISTCGTSPAEVDAVAPNSDSAAAVDSQDSAEPSGSTVNNNTLAQAAACVDQPTHPPETVEDRAEIGEGSALDDTPEQLGAI